MTIPFVAPGQHIQRLRRTYRVFTDQHGRQFGAVADMATNQPIGEFTPIDCMPPWLPPMRFAKWRMDGDLQFAWQYETMAAELAGGAQDYYQSAILFALEHNKPEPEIGGPVHPTIRIALGPPPLSPAIPLAAQAGDPWLLGMPNVPVNAVLREVLLQGTGSNNRAALDMIRTALKAKMDGMQTVPTVEMPEPVVERAKSITDVDEDAVLAEMANLTYPQFVAQCKGKKMTMPEIAALWNTHKAALATAQAG